jgi:hypothetical protein
MHMPKIEPTSAPAPHIARWYVQLPPRTAVLTFEQLHVAFRQGLIDSRTLVANDAVPSWTSLGQLARSREPRARSDREPITGKRRRAPTLTNESPARGVECGPAQPSTSPATAPLGSSSLWGAAGARARSLSALQGWRAAALAALFALATLRLGYGMIHPRLAIEAASPQPLQQLPPRAFANPLPERRPSAPSAESPVFSATLEHLPIVRAATLPFVPRPHQRQHPRRRGSSALPGAEQPRDQQGVETWREAARTTQPRSAR